METSTTTTVLLTAQELRNAIYTGSWLTDAKRYFSKNGCVAYKTANKYLNGEMNRQAYLERAIKWIAAREGSQYLSSDYKTDERNFEYNENVLYLSTEAAIIKIVELLRKESITSIDKFIEFSNWYADHFLISESVMFYAAAVFANVEHVEMPKKCKSKDFSLVKKGIKNQAWDLTYICTWSTVYSKETDSQCFMFATDDITQKVIIVNTIPPGECLKALYSIFTTKKEKEMLDILFESKFGKSRIQPMKELNDDEKVKNIKAIISEEYGLLQNMIQE